MKIQAASQMGAGCLLRRTVTAWHTLLLVTPLAIFILARGDRGFPVAAALSSDIRHSFKNKFNSHMSLVSYKTAGERGQLPGEARLPSSTTVKPIVSFTHSSSSVNDEFRGKSIARSFKSRDRKVAKGGQNKRGKPKSRTHRKTTRGSKPLASQQNRTKKRYHGRKQKKGPKATSQTAYNFNKKLTNILKRERYNRNAVERADSLLWQRVAPYLTQNKTSAKAVDSGRGFTFDLVSFNIVMLAWSRQASSEGAEQAHKWLRLIGKIGWKADSYSYGAVINGYAKAKSVKAAVAAEELLKQYSSTASLATDSLHNSCMDAWARSGHKAAGDRAAALLRELLSHPTIEPSTISYNTAIKAFANMGDAVKAQELLEEMKLSRTKPNKQTYTTCITAWSSVIKSQQHNELQDNTKCVEAVSRIRHLLNEMETTYNNTKDKRIQPDIYTYTTVLSARALPPLEIYARMSEYGDQAGFPNAAFLNTCMHLLGQALEKHNNGVEALGFDDEPVDPVKTAHVVETLLRQMQQQERLDKTSTTSACKVTYSSVISCWAQVGTEAAALRAEGLLDELQQIWETTNRYEFLPSAKTFCSVLTAWINVVSTEGRDDSAAIVDRAICLEKRMHDLYQRTKSPDLAPNRIIFVQLFQLMAKANDPLAATKAQEVLKQMEMYAKSGHDQVRPDATTLGSFLNTLTKNNVQNILELATVILEQVEDGYKSGAGYLKPNSLLYSAVLQAYSKSASQKGAAKAEQLLERTNNLFKEGKLYAKPTVLFYNAAIDAHARSNGGLKAAERAEELLSELWARSSVGDGSLKPTTRSYNACILAWKNSNVHGAPERAESLLELMKERDCEPDRVSYNSVLACWAKSTRDDGPQKARLLLISMENNGNGGDTRLRPDRISYNCCLGAFSKRGDATAATEIFERMLRKQIAPDQITLGCLRAAWTKSTSPEAQSQIARIDRLIQALRKKQTRLTRELKAP